MIEQHAHKRQSIDWAIIGVYLALVLIGWLNIYASVHSSEATSLFDWASRAGKQFVWILTSLGLATFILFLLPPRLWEGISIPFYIVVTFLLVVVIFVSNDVKGSHSWFDLGPIRFQPAEISKISTSLLLSLVLSQQNFRLAQFKHFMLAAAIIALLIGKTISISTIVLVIKILVRITVYHGIMIAYGKSCYIQILPANSDAVSAVSLTTEVDYRLCAIGSCDGNHIVGIARTVNLKCSSQIVLSIGNVQFIASLEFIDSRCQIIGRSNVVYLSPCYLWQG